MATQVGTKQDSGFEGAVYHNKERDNKFVAWKLATFSADRGREVPVTGITGEGGGPRAAAYNLDHSSDRSYLQNILRARVQYGAGTGGMSVNLTIPGAQVHVSGYEKPLGLTLSVNVENRSRQNMALGLGIMADRLANVVARGVYAQTQPEPKAEAEGEEDVEDIAF